MEIRYASRCWSAHSSRGVLIHYNNWVYSLFMEHLRKDSCALMKLRKFTVELESLEKYNDLNASVECLEVKTNASCACNNFNDELFILMIDFKDYINPHSAYRTINNSNG